MLVVLTVRARLRTVALVTALQARRPRARAGTARPPAGLRQHGDPGVGAGRHRFACRTVPAGSPRGACSSRRRPVPPEAFLRARALRVVPARARAPQHDRRPSVARRLGRADDRARAPSGSCSGSAATATPSARAGRRGRRPCARDARRDRGRGIARRARGHASRHAARRAAAGSSTTIRATAPRAGAR